MYTNTLEKYKFLSFQWNISYNIMCMHAQKKCSYKNKAKNNTPMHTHIIRNKILHIPISTI